MGFWHWLMGEEPEEKRDLESFIVSGAAFESLNTNWRLPSLREALGIPAVFRAVTMLSNIAGSLSIEAYRDGQRMQSSAVSAVSVECDQSDNGEQSVCRRITQPVDRRDAVRQRHWKRNRYDGE